MGMKILMLWSIIFLAGCAKPNDAKVNKSYMSYYDQKSVCSDIKKCRIQCELTILENNGIDCTPEHGEAPEICAEANGSLRCDSLNCSTLSICYSQIVLDYAYAE